MKEVFIEKTQYIHYNALTAGLCNYPEH